MQPDGRSRPEFRSGAASLEDRDVQGVDADLQDHLGVTRGGRGTERENLWSRRISFPD